jgi:hypothetical protein
MGKPKGPAEAPHETAYKAAMHRHETAGHLGPMVGCGQQECQAAVKTFGDRARVADIAAGRS